MTELELAKQSGCARINECYTMALKEGVVLTLSDSSTFSCGTKESLNDYKIVLDGYQVGFFIVDRTGRQVSDLTLIKEVVDQMSYWGITNYNKKVNLQNDIITATSIEQILQIVW